MFTTKLFFYLLFLFVFHLQSNFSASQEFQLPKIIIVSVFQCAGHPNYQEALSTGYFVSGMSQLAFPSLDRFARVHR